MRHILGIVVAFMVAAVLPLAPCWGQMVEPSNGSTPAPTADQSGGQVATAEATTPAGAAGKPAGDAEQPKLPPPAPPRISTPLPPQGGEAYTRAIAREEIRKAGGRRGPQGARGPRGRPGRDARLSDYPWMGQDLWSYRNGLTEDQRIQWSRMTWLRERIEALESSKADAAELKKLKDKLKQPQKDLEPAISFMKFFQEGPDALTIFLVLVAGFLIAGALIIGIARAL